jgi:hypothetical protein
MRPEPGDPLLIITDTSNDMNLAEVYLAAGLRARADAQLLVQRRPTRGVASEPGPIVSEAIWRYHRRESSSRGYYASHTDDLPRWQGDEWGRQTES